MIPFPTDEPLHRLIGLIKPLGDRVIVSNALSVHDSTTPQCQSRNTDWKDQQRSSDRKGEQVGLAEALVLEQLQNEAAAAASGGSGPGGQDAAKSNLYVEETWVTPWQGHR